MNEMMKEIPVKKTKFPEALSSMRSHKD